MKIALCYFGQARVVDNILLNLIKNSIEETDTVDTYIHCWWDNSKYSNVISGYGDDKGYLDITVDKNTIQNIQNILSPVKMLVEKSKKFNISDFNVVGPCIKPLHNTISRFYSNEIVYKLIDNPNEYDWIIFSRFDCMPRSYITKFDFKKMNKNICYSAYLHHHNHPSSILEMASGIVAEKLLGNIYTNINNYNLGTDGGGGESVIDNALKFYKIDRDFIPFYTKFDENSIKLYHSFYITNRYSSNGLIEPYNIP